MRTIDVLRSLGPIDARNVRRDSLLGWIILVPILMGLLMRFGVPPLAEAMRAQFGFDLSPYYPLMLSYFLITLCPLMFGMVIGFLLLDERDDRTLTALQVTPLTMNAYLAYRVAVPVVLTVVLMFVLFPLVDLADLSFGHILVAGLAAAPLAPLLALFLAGFAANKVQGFAALKGLGFVLMVVPTVGYFVRPPWHWAFGLVPTFWPMRVYWSLEAGHSQLWLHLHIALAYQALLLFLLLRRFDTVIHR